MACDDVDEVKKTSFLVSVQQRERERAFDLCDEVKKQFFYPNKVDDRFRA